MRIRVWVKRKIFSIDFISFIFDYLRVYKKTSSNQLLTLYLGSRELTARRGVIEPLKGVVYIDTKIMNGYKIFGQITLTFR